MKILVYSANFAPEPVGIGKYSGEMADWLVSKGHTVRVIAAPPYYPDWRVREDYRAAGYRRESCNGMTVWRAPIWVPKSPSGLKRIVHLLSFSASSLPLMLAQIFWRPDVVITVAPSFFCAPAGWLTARLSGAHGWLHMQDFEVDIAFRMQMLRSPILRRIALHLERWLLRRFDTVSSISRKMVERLADKGVSAKKAQFFPNWVDISHVNPSADGGRYRQPLGISPDAIVVLYSGSLAAKQGLRIIPRAAALLAHRNDIVFVICGDGIMKNQLSADCEGLRNVHLLPLQRFEHLGELLCAADLHLLPQSADAADLVLPSKLSGMLASGRPVIATCRAGTELDSIVSKCGVTVPPEDAAALARAIEALADDPVSRVLFGQQARIWAHLHADRDTVLQKMFGGFGEDSADESEPTALDPEPEFEIRVPARRKIPVSGARARDS